MGHLKLLPVVGLGGPRIPVSPASHLYESYAYQALIHHHVIILAALLCCASDLVSHDSRRCPVSFAARLCASLDHRGTRPYGLCSRVLGPRVLL
jgi:hypothetical protein